MYNAFGNTPKAKEIKKMIPEGTFIRINHLNGEDSRYNGKFGKVTFIDDMGDIHGTWGGLSIIPGVDDFSIL